MTEVLRFSFEVACGADHAFATWTEQIGLWWPADHTVSGSPTSIVLEGRVGGRIYEQTRHGREHEWGVVTAWRPPDLVAYRWHLGMGAERATDVAVTFLPVDAEMTRVEIEQSGWERLGSRGDGAARSQPDRVGVVGAALPCGCREGSVRMTTGTSDDPWVLKTPPGTSEYVMYRDEQAEPPQLVCQVGSTKLTYQLRAIDDLHAWLKQQGDWVALGAADEQKPASEATVEAWGRSPDNPVGGWYGLRKGYRGRFAMYVPPLMEALGLAEVTHDARNNKMRAKP